MSEARTDQPSLPEYTARLIHEDRLSLALDAGTVVVADARLYFTAPAATRDAVHAQLARVWAERDAGLLEAML